MTRIDIFSGFLGAGKTTLIKKLIKEGYKNEQLVLIENEFGEIGIDGGFLKEAGIKINEMNSGCICCSLVGDFRTALTKVLEEYHPDRILIEPSGVGKLSDVINAVKSVASEDVVLNSFVTVADASKVKSYMKNFGEFYNNQIEYASTIILSRTQNISDEKLEKALALIREHNTKASVVTTPWDDLTGEQILSATDGKALLTVDDVVEEHHHHHRHRPVPLRVQGQRLCPARPVCDLRLRMRADPGRRDRHVEKGRQGHLGLYHFRHCPGREPVYGRFAGPAGYRGRGGGSDHPGRQAGR